MILLQWSIIVKKQVIIWNYMKLYVIICSLHSNLTAFLQQEVTQRHEVLQFQTLRKLEIVAEPHQMRVSKIIPKDVG